MKEEEHEQEHEQDHDREQEIIDQNEAFKI